MLGEVVSVLSSDRDHHVVSPDGTGSVGTTGAQGIRRCCSTEPATTAPAGRWPDRTSRNGSPCGRWIVVDGGGRELASPTTSNGRRRISPRSSVRSTSRHTSSPTPTAAESITTRDAAIPCHEVATLADQAHIGHVLTPEAFSEIVLGFIADVG